MTIPDYYTIITDDGSHTIGIAKAITFHSTHGAIQESNHVFIEAALKHYTALYPEKKNIKIFEIGFGTGLNALLTAMQAQMLMVNIKYASIDLYPLPDKIFLTLNYAKLLQEKDLYKKVMLADWNDSTVISRFFKLEKIQADFTKYSFAEKFDIIFFDAFAPDDQPELWTADVFLKIFKSMNEGGILTTYCSKSIVQRRLKEAGFSIKKIPGPPGKREILQAVKS